jgi:hypothetical protein
MLAMIWLKEDKAEGHFACNEQQNCIILCIGHYRDNRKPIGTLILPAKHCQRQFRQIRNVRMVLYRLMTASSPRVVHRRLLQVYVY